MKLFHQLHSHHRKSQQNKRTRARKCNFARRRLRHELLEDRRLLAVITVNDFTDGTLAELAGDGKVSLREAIEAANTDTSVDGSVAGDGADVIQFAADATPSEIRINTIGGTIDGASAFDITSNITVLGAVGDQDIRLVSADPAQHRFRLFLISSEAELVLRDIVISDFHSEDFGGGGAIVMYSGSLRVYDSTFSGNGTTNGQGGAINMYFRSSAYISQSTFIGNFARTASAIGNHGTAHLLNSTIVGNRSVNLVQPALGTGTTIASGETYTGTFYVGNSLVAKNSNGSGTSGTDVQGNFISLGHNLIGQGDGSAGFGQPTDMVGSEAAPLDPRIAILPASIDGASQVVLLPDSPAIDAGGTALPAIPLDHFATNRFAEDYLYVPFFDNPRNAPIVTPDGKAQLNIGTGAAAFVWNGGESLKEVGDRVSIDFRYNYPLDAPTPSRGVASAGLALFSEPTGGLLLAEVRVEQNLANEANRLFLAGSDAIMLNVLPSGPYTLQLLVTALAKNSMTLEARLSAEGMNDVTSTFTVRYEEVFFGPVAFNVQDDDVVHDNLDFSTHVDQRGAPFNRVVDGNGDNVARMDIGATEFQLYDMGDAKHVVLSDTDMDADGVPDNVDNCYLDPNTEQIDNDADGFGAACDPDDNDRTIRGSEPILKYPILRSENGARHLVNDLRLGTAVNADIDAETDQDNATDDGVVWLGDLIRRAQATPQVTVTGTGKLDAWVDFNQDGDWDDAGEQIAFSEMLVDETTNLSFTVPNDAVLGTTYARFRISTEGNLGPTGVATSGEVEDYAVTIGDDNVAPTVLALFEQSALSTMNHQSLVYFEFSEPVIGFNLDDVAVENGSLFNLQGSGSSFTAIFEAGGDIEGQGLVTVGTGYTDLAGNPGASDTSIVSIDTRLPDVSITSDRSDIGLFESASITFSFTEPVEGFDPSEDVVLLLNNVTAPKSWLSNLSGGPEVFTATLTPSNDQFGSLQLRIAGLYTDAAGNAGVAGSATTSDAISINTLPYMDYGDAPTAAQSGFAQDYPVTYEQDGARHLLGGNLFLGSSIDNEADGQPDAAAGQDGQGGDDNDNHTDEDGVFVLADMVALQSTATTSSFVVIAFGSGKLDAWIDFNQDGDWNDPGEQIFTSVDVVDGQNVLPFQVPAGATPGSTGARFRISSAGGLSPTGFSADGEVEDYIAHVLDGDAVGGVHAEFDATSFSLFTEILQIDDAIIVRAHSRDLFQVPLTNLANMRVVGTLNASFMDVWHLVRAGRITSQDNNFLTITDSSETLDFRELPPAAMTGIWGIFFSSSNQFLFDFEAMQRILDPAVTEPSMIFSGLDSVIDFGPGWQVAQPRYHRFPSDEVNHSLSQAGINLGITTPTGFKNPANRLDVNYDGFVSPIDALLAVNQLNLGEGGLLQLPASPAEHLYLDPSGDNFLSPIDALLIINHLNSSGAGEGEAPPPWTSSVAVPPTDFRTRIYSPLDESEKRPQAKRLPNPQKQSNDLGLVYGPVEQSAKLPHAAVDLAMQNLLDFDVELSQSLEELRFKVLNGEDFVSHSLGTSD